MAGYAGKYTGGYSGPLAGRSSLPTLASAYLFDHGLHKPLRLVVLDAVVLLLDRLLATSGGYLEAVESTTSIVEGKADDDEIMDIVDQLGARAPAIIVATGDREFETAGDISRWRGPLTVHVYFLANGMRSQLARAAGDVVSAASPTADPGVFVAMEHALMLLAGQNPGGTKGVIKDLRPVRERRIGTDGDRELWEQIYTVELSSSIDLKRDISLELKQINTYNRLGEQAATDEPIVETETEVNP